MKRPKIAASVAALVVTLLLATRAAAEPPPAPTHFTVPVTCQDDATPPHTIRLDPGYYLDADTWDYLDTRVRELQNAETRLTAENKSLRDSAGGAGWWWVAAGVTLGAAAGVYAGTRL